MTSTGHTPVRVAGGRRTHKIGYTKHILFTDRSFGLHVFDIGSRTDHRTRQEPA
ncbi:hypothetical protein GCM10010168_13020 [Actinoplanes ianthinogenes]|uniref:Transposase n=1 Tax=Actinoplanes ianthinogenes TaxID=122358 RepID=A0ABM7LYT5_9ACTN|nr:hypothetical protein [Actinoplanes ianthinogenes]BCJ44488.1 hypothetical protein Aiant_51450 [Actinoplanes ianthinogenes]GGQ98278.1 hypothetical protein GCM10010168_13020 [Actinoplanes ianthinogenes]